jgi:hypothetical protein
VFAFKNFGSGTFYKPIATYDGFNFEEIAEGLKKKIESGEV